MGRARVGRLRRARCLVKALGLVLLAGCELFAAIPNGSVQVDAPPGQLACSGPADCAAPTPACDLEIGACFECVTTADCSGGEVCSNHACGGCTEDAECGSSVCLADGTCADAARVLFADPAGTGPDCTSAAPCGLDAAFAKVTATADIVKLLPGTYNQAATVVIAASTIVAGSGATIHANVAMFTPMFTVSGQRTLTLLGVTVDGEPGSQHGGAQCLDTSKLVIDRSKFSGGVVGVIASPCELSIDRSTIIGASFYGVYANAGPVSITNTYILENGGSFEYGGLVLDSVPSGVVEHSTIAGNLTTAAGFAGIRCIASPALVTRSNIVFGNTGGTANDPACAISYSVIDPGYTGAGTNNTVIDPGFVDPAASDYHLQAASPARGLGDPASPTARDADGQPRPQPAGSPSDPGADEVP
ncbi:MAG: right-handed parallel beta-helix repeat-containing protein [Kofleriaceae bacterium]